MTKYFDYIIIGGGSAGCVLANRLSSDARISVLLIEAGEWDKNPWIHIPLGYGRHFENPKVNWMYHSAPEAETSNRKIFQPTGNKCVQKGMCFRRNCCKKLVSKDKSVGRNH